MHSPVRNLARDDIDRVLHAAMADDSLELPPPPQVVTEILRLTRGDGIEGDDVDATASELARLIQRDVALAGQIMRVANSALYARRNPVGTLPQAITWLGMREIRNIAFAVAVQGQIFASAYFRAEMADLWRESMITALFAQEIAKLKQRNADSAYLCGLLHRAGIAVLLSRAGSAVTRHQLTPDPVEVVRLAERHEPRIGMRLAIAWQLPGAVGESIAHWRDPHAAEAARLDVMEVALARHVSEEPHAPGAGGELPESMLGPVSDWMAELGIHLEELFSLMAQRAAICATAESFVSR